MSDEISPSGTNSVSTDGWTIQSNTASADEIQKGLESLPKAERQIKPIPDKPKGEAKDEKPDLSKAASALGREGGKAAAEARKQRAESEPVPDVHGVDERAGDLEEKGEEVPEKPLGKPRDDPRARMLEATRQAAEAKRERDYYRALYEQARQGQPQAEPETPQLEKPPFKPEDFPEYEDYLSAREAWTLDRWRQQAAQEAELSGFANRIDSAVQDFHGRIQEAFGQEYESKISEEVRLLRPSFALSAGEPVGAENVVADEILSSERAPALMVYLSEHPEVFQRLATLPSPQAVQREMAKLEGRLEAATTATQPQLRSVSKAPPPVRPVTGTPMTSENELTGEESYDEHVRIMNARERARLRR